MFTIKKKHFPFILKKKKKRETFPMLFPLYHLFKLISINLSENYLQCVYLYAFPLRFCIQKNTIRKETNRDEKEKKFMRCTNYTELLHNHRKKKLFIDIVVVFPAVNNLKVTDCDAYVKI